MYQRKLQLIEQIINNYPKYMLSSEDTITLVSLLLIDEEKVNYQQYIESAGGEKSKLKGLFSKKIISLKETQDGVIIYLDGLESLLNPSREPASNIVDFIADSLGYKLNSRQIMQVNQWTQMGISLQMIEEGILKAKANGVTKFEYVAAVINNSSQSTLSKPRMITRNWNY